jgi:CheY-like chemotaxis protein
VLADPCQIEQVLLNLAINARDAMPSGGKLTIETSNAELGEAYAAQHIGVEPGSYVLLGVGDTGCGMDDYTQSRIFEPFFTTKDKDKGTGLGLSTVYGIIKQFGGSIWVESEPGRGSAFTIYLPRSVAPGVAVSVATGNRTRPVGTETILVVEDEESIRILARRILSAAGYTVLIAENGKEALRASEQYDGDIDLLLTDVVMPGMGGQTLAERLSIVRPGIKVLYMSGYAENPVIHHGVLDSKTNFIGKPFAPEDITRKIREVLEGKQG